MKTAVIMQPTYLPWIGYFDLMDQSDYFVFLDSVQFEKRSWQQRNRIKTSAGELQLSVPVLTKGKFQQKITDVGIDATHSFYKKHLKSVKLNYSKATFYNKYIIGLEKILYKQHTYLVKLNIELIKWLKEQLTIKTHLLRSSQLNVRGNSTELLVNICKDLGAETYLSPIGSKSYIQEGKLFSDNNIKLQYHDFKHPTYHQLDGKFIPYLSVIDLLFNEGDSSLKVIRSGR